VPFTKPSRSESYDVMGEAAARAALLDAGVDYGKVQQAYVGYVYGDSTAGQAVLYGLGTTGVPVVNVNNNCASGSSALFLARQAVASGAVDCALAVGFDQMRPGALAMQWDDRPSPLARHDAVRHSLQPADSSDAASPLAAQYFGGAAREHMKRFGTTVDAFAKVAVKARRHAAGNPNAVFRDPVSVDDVLGSPPVYGPLTRLMCCPPTSGAAAAVLCSSDMVRRLGLDARVVLRSQALVTDSPATFESGDMRELVGYGMAVTASERVYADAGVGPMDVDVVELHDCFAPAEVLAYEGLGLTPEGTSEKFIADGDNTYGGRVVTNPSGGLLSKGHPLGATGLAQCAELVWQLRGEAGARQVEGARIGLQHNVGLGGACVVGIYERVTQ